MSDASPVTVFDRWRAEPVFHLQAAWGERHDVFSYERDDGLIVVEHRWSTACGRVIDRWGWTEDPAATDWSKRHRDQWDNRHGAAITLRRDHAETIGRLCLRCAAWADG